MLGSHNSLTGYPCKWYLIPFNIFSKCQSGTIEQQLQKNVKFFDIRIKVKSDGSYYVSHGLARYITESYSSIIEKLRYYSEQDHNHLYYRVMLEYIIKNQRIYQRLRRTKIRRTK